MNWQYSFKKLWKSEILAVILFFLILLVIGTLIYADYGLSWDEPTQLDLGLKTYRYIFKGDPSLLDMQYKWYGPIYELFLVFAQNKESDMQVYLSRHYLNFLTFFVGCIFFYYLSNRLVKHAWLALMGTICLVLSPRIFADAFYNPKDIPFLVLYLIGLTSMLLFLDKPNIPRAVIHALVSAALVSVRLPGLVIPALTFLGLLIEWITRRVKWKSALLLYSLYGILCIGFGILIWPALWPDPLNGFVEAFQQMSHFPYDVSMLFMGDIISSVNLPWYYLPVWITITTPLLYLLAFIPGMITILWNQKTWFKLKISQAQRDESLVLLAFWIPLLTVILINSVLYDAWRQMFFIYPPLLLVAIKGFCWIWEWLKLRLPKSLLSAAVFLFVLIGILPIGWWMIINHPYQNVFFNRLAGKDMQTIQQNYMMDYWGLAYREGIEALLAVDDRAQINVFMETAPGQRTLAMLPVEEAIRIHVVDDLRKADYFIGNYYLLKESYPFKEEIYTIKVGNASILSVFKLSEEEKN